MPLCSPRNSRGGPRFATSASSRGVPSRANLTQDPPEHLHISGRIQPSGVRYQRIDGDIPISGRAVPRLSISAYGDDTLGPEVTHWAAKHMPFPLMEWNKLAINGLLATDGDRLLHRSGLVTTGRQNSKTSLALALAGWWLDEYADRRGAQTVTWTAHDLKLSELAFFQLSTMLDHRIVRTSSSYGRQRILLNNGSRLHVVAATLGAGHGLSIDLAIVDECWRVSPEAYDHGLAPAQRARPSPLALLLSPLAMSRACS